MMDNLDGIRDPEDYMTDEYIDEFYYCQICSTYDGLIDGLCPDCRKARHIGLKIAGDQLNLAKANALYARD